LKDVVVFSPTIGWTDKTLPLSSLSLTVAFFFFQPFVLKQKVEPKIQADSKTVSH
jgi:hypothetical protein